MTSSPSSIAELRAVAQPEATLGRANAEHWAGRLYMRRVSPYLTWLVLRTPLTANGVTWLMIGSGLVAAAALSAPGIAAVVAAFLLIQVQLLLDCSDGEVARWRGTTSPAGVYLDRIGHYSTEALLPAALGVRAAGGWGSLDGWTMLGLLLGILVLVIKAETDLVHVARAFAGLPLVEDAAHAKVPRRSRLRALRRLVRFVPFYRFFVAVEATALALAAGVIDAIVGGLAGTRLLLVLLLPAALITVVGHLLAVLSSNRLR